MLITTTWAFGPVESTCRKNVVRPGRLDDVDVEAHGRLLSRCVHPGSAWRANGSAARATWHPPSIEPTVSRATALGPEGGTRRAGRAGGRSGGGARRSRGRAARAAGGRAGDRGAPRTVPRIGTRRPAASAARAPVRTAPSARTKCSCSASVAALDERRDARLRRDLLERQQAEAGSAAPVRSSHVAVATHSPQSAS